jgi:TPR repeat protein/CHAT domain-containing protein
LQLNFAVCGQFNAKLVGGALFAAEVVGSMLRIAMFPFRKMWALLLCSLMLFCSASVSLGQSDETLCDRLAASPTDLHKIGSGVDFDALDAEPAVRACEDAIKTSPNVPRLEFQLGRALQKAGRNEEAVRLYEPLADIGYPTAAHNLGLMYISGVGVSQSFERGMELVRRAAQNGLSISQFQLGLWYLNGFHLARDPSTAATWFQRAVEQGHAGAQNELGVLYQTGIGVPVDPKKAFELYKASAEGENTYAQYNLGRMFALGVAVEKDFAEAIRLYEMAAEKGHVQAQIELGTFYENGTGVPRDFSKAFSIYRKLAEHGNPTGQANLGRLFANGLGVEKNLSEAARWYSMSADQGNAWAQNELGLLYQNGWGVEKDYAKAFDLYRKAAALGNTVAQGNVGWMYANGLGVTQNLVEAAKWYSTAADGGNAWAQAALGDLYQTGRGVGQDYSKAVDLYRKAAAQGDSSAQLRLGWMYANGFGVSRDFAEARKSYLLAAENHEAAAMAQLGWLYVNGRGVPKDDLKAYLWYHAAIDAGYEGAFVPMGQLMTQGAFQVAPDTAQNLQHGIDQARAVIASRPRQYILLNRPSFVDRTDWQQLTAARRKKDWDADADIQYARAYAISADPILSKWKHIARRAMEMQRGEILLEAVFWLEKGADQGSPDALLSLANVHITESETTQSEVQIKNVSTYPLGVTHSPSLSHFIGSPSKAVELYEAAIAKGSLAARINLATMYQLGLGVQRDTQRAFELYKSAIGTAFGPQAEMGLLLNSLEAQWQHEQLRKRHALTSLSVSKQPQDSDDVVMTSDSDFQGIVVADMLGRRIFTGRMSRGQQYRVPSARDDLVLWSDAAKDVGLKIQIGSRVIQFPAEYGQGLRLNRGLLKRGAIELVHDGRDDYGSHLPEETLRESRITIEAVTNADLYLRSGDYLISEHHESLRPASKFQIQNVPDLELELRPRFVSPGDDQQETSRVKVLVDGVPVLVLSAAHECMVRLQLDPTVLTSEKRVMSDPEDCSDWEEQSPPRSLLVAESGKPSASVQRLPDESIPKRSGGVRTVRGALHVNEGISLLSLVMGGRWDEVLRAAKIIVDWHMRDDGPNSFETIRAELELCDAEVQTGDTDSARRRLDDIMDRANKIGSIPIQTQIDFDERFGHLLTKLGRFGEAERFLFLAMALREEQSQLDSKRAMLSPDLNDLVEVNEGLGSLDNALMYLLLNQMSARGGAAESSDSFQREIAPGFLVQLIDLLRRTGRDESAEALLPVAHREAKRDIVRDEPEPLQFPLNLSVFEQTFGPVDYSELIAGDLGYLAQVYSWMGRHQEALPLLEQLVTTERNIYGAKNPRSVVALARVAREYKSIGNVDKARFLAKESFNSALEFAEERRYWAQTAQSASQALSIPAFALLEANYADGSARDTLLTEQSFEVVQRLQNSSAALALQAVAIRLGEGDAHVQEIVRRRQDLSLELTRLDATLVASSGVQLQGQSEQKEEIKRKLEQVEALLREIESALPPKLQSVDELGLARTVSYEDLRQDLRSNEALLTFSLSDDVTYLFVATTERLQWFRIELGAYSIGQLVSTLRCGLDYSGAWQGEGSRCSDLVKVTYGPLDHERGRPLPFDLTRGYELYKALFGQAEGLIEGKHLLIVPSGPLTQLPFQALVTDPPKTRIPTSSSGYRDVAWLIRKHAVTVLPAVSSLAALRGSAKHSRATEAYIGFGNPLLDGDPSRFPDDAVRAKLAREKRCNRTLRERVASLLDLHGAPGLVARGANGLAAVADIRRQMPLPETVDELCDVAHNLGVYPAAHVYIGAEATETQVKKLSDDGTLAKHRIVHFATHGVLAGQLSSMTEPGLILTPPSNSDETDDGYLSASEIAALKLDADWVILSACNTAAGDGSGAEALSGLARAFFYAGARSLLVSHWEVASDATVKLITKTVALLNVKLGRAEALRRSMLSMISTGSEYEAHPAFWAPFVLVGEGGVGR